MKRWMTLGVALLMAACGGSGNNTGGTTSTTGTGGTGGGTGGAGGSTGGTGGGMCTATPPADDTLADQRKACAFHAGDSALDTIGITAQQRDAIPIKHLVIVVEENRSFDHLYGKLSGSGQPDAEGWPASFTNPDTSNKAVAPFHLTSTCLPADPPHQWDAMHAGWDNGKMDGFVKSAAVNGQDGHYVMGYYDASDLPFYYWLASTFAISDRYFGATLGGTWANRDYLYAGTSGGVMNTGGGVFSGPTIFDALDKAKVTWGVYTSGNVRQDSLGWTNAHAGVGTFDDFIGALNMGTLPAVSFVDPGLGQDEHPPNNVQFGEHWAKLIYDAAIASPLWPELAIVYTYDESGGLADHVPPPAACVASPDQAVFDNLGVRVPVFVISPWARAHYVSHRTHEHDSTLRLIELLHDLPALTARDANADAMLDLFDFGCPALMTPPAAPDVGMNGCP